MNIKDSNPLFKQRNLSAEELVTNLKLLLQKSDLTLASTVTMDDLEKVVGTDPIISNASTMKDPSLNLDAMDSPTCNEERSIASGITTSSWNVGEFIAASFEDGFFIGEVLEIIDHNTVQVDYMIP